MENHSPYADYHHYIEEQVLDMNNLMIGNTNPNDMETDEDAIERKRILNFIYANDFKGLKDMKITTIDLNWRERH